MLQKYSVHGDPTNTVDLQNPREVMAAVDAILHKRFGDGYGRPLLDTAIGHLAQAYSGEYPGLLRCDTHYHDLRHALDTGLAMARLIDGQGMVTPADAADHIDAEYALLGILLALYHDIGLLRRVGEEDMQGAQLTPVHEARGVEFMRDYLTRTPLAHLADKADLIMITRLVWHMPDGIAPLDRAISCLLGTADIISQLADRCYLEKCRDFLFIEFSAIGLAGSPDLPYPDPETLLRKTPSFYTGLLRERIHNEYGDADRYMKIHFGGECPYTAAIARNFSFLNELLVEEDLSRLSRQPVRVIDAKH